MDFNSREVVGFEALIEAWNVVFVLGVDEVGMYSQPKSVANYSDEEPTTEAALLIQLCNFDGVEPPFSSHQTPTESDQSLLCCASLLCTSCMLLI